MRQGYFLTQEGPAELISKQDAHKGSLIAMSPISQAYVVFASVNLVYSLSRSCPSRRYSSKRQALAHTPQKYERQGSHAGAHTLQLHDAWVGASQATSVWAEESVARANIPGCAHAEWAAPSDHWHQLLNSGFATRGCLRGPGRVVCGTSADAVVAIDCGPCGAGQPAVKRQLKQVILGSRQVRCGRTAVYAKHTRASMGVMRLPGCRLLQVRHRPFRDARTSQGDVGQATRLFCV